MKTKLTREEIGEIINNEWLVFTTSKDSIPRSIIVLPSRVDPDRIILSNVQMNKSIENVMSNPHCFINVYIKEKNDKQYKIDCEAEVYSDGELFDKIKDYEETCNLPEGYTVNSIIVANIKSVEVSGE